MISIKSIKSERKLDGILGTFKTDNVDFCYSSNLNDIRSNPCLILYEPYKDITYAKYEYKSEISFNFYPTQFLFCNDRNILIYENEGKFYKLNLNQVESEDDLSKFNELKQNEQI